MIEGIFIDDNNLMDVRKVYDLTYRNEFDLHDDYVKVECDINYIYIVVYENKEPVGAGRLNVRTFTLDKIIVVKEHRGKFYGDLVVRMLLDKAFRYSANKVSVLCFEVEIGFYEKIGFVYEDNTSDELGNRFIKMHIDKNGLSRKCCAK